jgi:hypothetical protein
MPDEQLILMSSLRSDGLGRFQPVISAPRPATDIALGLVNAMLGRCRACRVGGNDRRGQATHRTSVRGVRGFVGRTGYGLSR